MVAKKKVKAKPKEVDIFYPKAVHHQTIAADGAWAAMTSQLELQIAFYKEIQPMPKRVRYSLDQQGTLSEVTEKEGDVGIVRETGVTVVMNPGVAAQLVGLLQQMLNQIQPQMDARIKKMEKAISDAQAQVDTNVAVEG